MWNRNKRTYQKGPHEPCKASKHPSHCLGYQEQWSRRQGASAQPGIWHIVGLFCLHLEEIK